MLWMSIGVAVGCCCPHSTGRTCKRVPYLADILSHVRLTCTHRRLTVPAADNTCPIPNAFWTGNELFIHQELAAPTTVGTPAVPTILIDTSIACTMYADVHNESGNHASITSAGDAEPIATAVSARAHIRVVAVRKRAPQSTSAVLGLALSQRIIRG